MCSVLKGVSAPQRTGLASQDALLAPPRSRSFFFFSVQSQTSRIEIETVTDLPSGSGPRLGPRGGRQRPESRSAWEAASLHQGGRSHRLQRLPDALQQRSGRLGPPKLRPAARAARPAPLRVRAPPRASPGGGSAGARRAGAPGAREEGRATGPAQRARRTGELGRPQLTPPATFLSRPPRVDARRGKPRRGAQARPCSPTGRRAIPREAARGRRAPPPPPRPRPQRAAAAVAAAAARWRLSPRARQLPAVFRWQSYAVATRGEGTPRGLSPRRRHRPFRPPRGKAQPAAPLFYLPGVFARALARSVARLSPLARIRFLSFLLFTRPRGRFFRSRRPRSPARALLPAGLGGAGRPAALPAPSTRAPAEAVAALRAPTHSNMARAQGACARAPPHHPPPAPRSCWQPAPLVPRAWRTPGPISRRRSCVCQPGCGRAEDEVSAG